MTARPSAGSKRPGVRWLVAALAIVLLAAVARFAGASWPQIVWGGLGLLVCAVLTEFLTWLTTGGPLRLERRPVEDPERRAGRPE